MPVQTLFKGKVWAFDDNVSTDLIMPAQTRAQRLGDHEAARYCFSAHRPGWVDQVKPGDILVAGKNFGCGSSRPAPRMLQCNGITVVLAETISRIFLRSATNIALPVLWCKGVRAAFDEGNIAEVNVETGVVRNLTKKIVLQAEPWPKDSPPMQIYMAGGLMPFIEKMLRERWDGEGVV